MIAHFYIRFATRYGQTLAITGSHTALGNDQLDAAVQMNYFNDQLWQVSVDLGETDKKSLDIQYRYLLIDEDGTLVEEWGDDRILPVSKISTSQVTCIDTWNHAGDVNNAFFTQAFQGVLLPASNATKAKEPKQFTHTFKVKAPLLGPDEVLCICGDGPDLGDWGTVKPLLLSKEGNWWTTKLNLTHSIFPLRYKYGVYNSANHAFSYFENGSNREIFNNSIEAQQTIIHDGFAQLSYPNWRGAGVAIPVFSLRSENSLGVGEFTDIKLLVDWGKQVGLKLIQLLPINDTTANHTWTDSYPYAAVSAFALHPMFLNVEKLVVKNPALTKRLKAARVELNALPDVDYEQVMEIKWDAIRTVYAKKKGQFQQEAEYQAFFVQNAEWLVPYAAFCYLRDKYKTSDYNQWAEHQVYNVDAIAKLSDPSSDVYDEIAIHYFLQYQLHLQLTEATAYAHEHGMVVKGDLPIGIYRYSCDAWVSPDLYNMNAQAGAPPDDFAVKGQNWGFPTYNWQRMQADGFAWWASRFRQMGRYFDAFRIDHILGFFRIWSIPLHAVEGIMGRFVPAIPVHISEFHQQGIYFDYQRYCRPYISENLLNSRLGDQVQFVKDTFLQWQEGSWQFKPEFETQRQVEAYFAGLDASEHNDWLRQELYDLQSNFILIEETGSNGQQFHFRIAMEQTASFADLDGGTQAKLKELYVNYFYRRQDDFWKKEALNKLPKLKRTTNMLVCGEDLGMVPDCVPDVMAQLGLLSLEIQRMPKDPKREFFHPADAPYLSVVTPSTHDMSTIRGWWEEDGAKTQRFFNQMLGHYGASPFYCSDWINREILIQHLYAPSMWSIFQLQDILGISSELRRENPNDERINIPANPKHYWRYRMHHTLESLLTQEAFNSELRGYVEASGRL